MKRNQTDKYQGRLRLAALAAVLSCSLLLSGCGLSGGISGGKGKEEKSSAMASSTLTESSEGSGETEETEGDGSAVSNADSDKEGEEQGTDSLISAGQNEENSQESADTQESSETVHGMKELTVAPGEYLTQIFRDLVDLGFADSVETLIDLSESIPRDQFVIFGPPETEEQAEREAARAFLAEGFIAPGSYQLDENMTAEEVLESLLSSWDVLFTEEMREQAAEEGFTPEEVLTMASIVEYESSFDPYDIVKPQVAAVVRNRVAYPMGLEMDTTVFYLQEALEPYLDPEDYEDAYDTYSTDRLPAGPISSPSPESVLAVLEPADTNDLFFIYDKEGNYYFAEDYETHLSNVEKYLD